MLIQQLICDIGTATFVRGQNYAINVALLEGDKQVLSVVGCPLLAIDAVGPITDDSIDPTGEGSIVFAVKGHGTWVRRLNGSADEVVPRRVGQAGAGGQLRSVSSVNPLVGSGIDDAHKAVMQKIGVQDFPGCNLLAWVLRHVSLALGFANVAVWIYSSPERLAKIWDHAGAILLFEEVGGKVTDIFGRDIDMGVGRKLSGNHGFVSAPKESTLR